MITRKITNKGIVALACSLALLVGSFATFQVSEAGKGKNNELTDTNITANYENIQKHSMKDIGFTESKSPYNLNTVDGVKKEYVRYMNEYIEFICKEKYNIKPWFIPIETYKVYTRTTWKKATGEHAVGDYKDDEQEMSPPFQILNPKDLTYEQVNTIKVGDIKSENIYFKEVVTKVEKLDKGITVPKLTGVKDSPAYTQAIKNYISDRNFKNAKFNSSNKVTGIKVYRSNTSALIEFDRFGGAKKYSIYAKVKGKKKHKTKGKHKIYEKDGYKHSHKYIYKNKKWSGYKLLGTVSESDYKFIDYSKRQFVLYRKQKYSFRNTYKFKIVAECGNEKSKNSEVVKSKEVKKPSKVFFCYDAIPKVNYYRMNHKYKNDGKVLGKGKDIGITKALWCHAWEKAVKSINTRQHKKKSCYHIAKKSDWAYLKNGKWSSEYNKATTGAPYDENTANGGGCAGSVAGWYDSPGHKPGIIQGYQGRLYTNCYYDEWGMGSFAPYAYYEKCTFGICCSSTNYKSGSDWNGADEYVSGDIRELYLNGYKDEYRAGNNMINGMPTFLLQVNSNQETFLYKTIK